MRWAFFLQIVLTGSLAALSGWLGGLEAARSAALGGSINLVAGVAYAAVASLTKPASAATALQSLLRAEAVKILVVIALLWAVLTRYGPLVPLAFFATFVATVFVFSAAVFFRDR